MDEEYVERLNLGWPFLRLVKDFLDWSGLGEKVEATIKCLSELIFSREVREGWKEIGIMAEGLEERIEVLGDSDFSKPVGSSDSSKDPSMWAMEEGKPSFIWSWNEPLEKFKEWVVILKTLVC